MSTKLQLIDLLVRYNAKLESLFSLFLLRAQLHSCFFLLYFVNNCPFGSLHGDDGRGAVIRGTRRHLWFNGQFWVRSAINSTQNNLIYIGSW